MLALKVMRDDALFQIIILALQELLRKAITLPIIIFPNATEGALNSQARTAAEVICQIQQPGILFRRAMCHERLGPRAGGGDGVEFGPDIDEPAKQGLLAFELRTEADHGVEQPARQAAAAPGSVTEMPGQFRDR